MSALYSTKFSGLCSDNSYSIARRYRDGIKILKFHKLFVFLFFEGIFLSKLLEYRISNLIICVKKMYIYFI